MAEPYTRKSQPRRRILISAWLMMRLMSAISSMAVFTFASLLWFSEADICCVMIISPSGNNWEPDDGSETL